MKHLIRFLVLIQAVCLFSAGVNAETAGKSIVVLGAPLVLKNEKSTAGQYLAEYIPENETFDNFTKMFAVWGRLDGSDAQAQMKAKIQFVASRKGTDPLANYGAFQSDDKKTFGLDFLISEGGVMEHNVWSFQNVKGGVLAYQYVRRRYEGKSAQSGENFIKEIPSIRDQALTFFKTASLPRPQGY
ncbi:MAG TPA: hypothetical protein VFX30_02865 [bacterium]|nr:hypothetical protein [bacterium]